MATLFFLQAMAAGMWMVPLSRVLMAHGYPELRSYAFASSALAAFVSPLIFGAMADRHASPVRVLKGLAIASAASMALAGWAIGHRWPAGAVLVVIQVYSICSVPTGSISSAIVFSRLQDAQRQFGPVRAMATVGWMVGCWLISAFQADASTRAAYIGAAAWVGLAAFTFFLPSVPPPPSGPPTFRERMGWDALALLKNHDHRVVFIIIALFSIPLSAFYPYAPAHLNELGFRHTTALMSLGQVTEIFAMFGLARLFLWLRLKWIFAAGLAFGVIRYVFSAFDTPGWLLAGVTLHGVSFALVYVTAQIYLNERVDPAWRVRAQALLTLMMSGIGNLVGYLSNGFWMAACTTPARTNWTLFWAGLAGSMAAVMAYFLVAYHGQSGGLRRKPPASSQ